MALARSTWSVHISHHNPWLASSLYHCNALQYTATLHKTLQHATTPCNTQHCTATHCKTVRHHAKDSDVTVVLEIWSGGHVTWVRALRILDPYYWYRCHNVEHHLCCSLLQFFAVGCSMLQCVAKVSQCVAVCCSVSQCVAVCCSVLQCIAVCCSVLQCV